MCQPDRFESEQELDSRKEKTGKEDGEEGGKKPSLPQEQERCEDGPDVKVHVGLCKGPEGRALAGLEPRLGLAREETPVPPEEVAHETRHGLAHHLR